MNRSPSEKPIRVYMRVSPQEKRQIENLAKSCGLSTAEYLRKWALGYAPRVVLPDAFFHFNEMLCQLCDEVADIISPAIENRLLEAADDIQRQLLLPEKSTAKQIRQEVTKWQQQDSGPSKDS